MMGALRTFLNLMLLIIINELNGRKVGRAFRVFRQFHSRTHLPFSSLFFFVVTRIQIRGKVSQSNSLTTMTTLIAGIWFLPKPTKPLRSSNHPTTYEVGGFYPRKVIPLRVENYVLEATLTIRQVRQTKHDIHTCTCIYNLPFPPDG